MTDQWVPAPPQPPPPDPPAGLPPANSWSPVTPCAAADSPKIADGVIITGRPAVVSAMPWQITLNDGLNPPNFTIDHYDATGVLIDHPMSVSGIDGTVTFHDPVMLSRDPVQPLEASTRQFVLANAAGITDAPNDGTTYARKSAAWAHLTHSDITDWAASMPAPYVLPIASTTVLGGVRVDGSTITIASGVISSAPAGIADAPNNGSSYVRNNAAWTLLGGPYLPLSGGTVSGGTAFTAGIILAGPSNLSMGGGTPGQVLTKGASGGVTQWGDIPPSGITDAPSDGTAYARKSAAWSHLTHTDITDWATAAAPPVTISDTAPSSPTVGALWWDSVGGQLYVWYTDPNTSQWVIAVSGGPVASTALPLADGAAAVGTSAAYARADHVHPITFLNDNKIINGDMRIDQRNNGASGTAINVYTIDRWQYNVSQTGKGTWQRGATGPITLGFPYFLAFTSASAYALLTSDYFQFSQTIEADMVSDFAWGTAGAQPVTLSFLVYSSLTGTFSGCISNAAATRSYPFTFSLPVASAWTRIVLTIPGDTAGTWVMNGNAGSVVVHFDLGAGSTFRGPANAWASVNYVGATGAVSVVGTNAATFYVTGVKLEIGSVATPYNRQSLAKSMIDCQRYYQYIPALGGAGYGTSGTVIQQTYLLSVMRATPTAVATWGANTNLPASITPSITQSTAGCAVLISATMTGTGQWGFNLNILNLSAEL